MKKRIHALLAMVIIIIPLIGCGGGGGGGSTDTPPPSNSPGVVSLAWDPVTTNTDNTPCTDLAGYRLYYSQSTPVTKENSTRIDVGNATNADVGNLNRGITYYFRVSAYDNTGLESELSSDEAMKIPL